MKNVLDSENHTSAVLLQSCSPTSHEVTTVLSLDCLAGIFTAFLHDKLNQIEDLGDPVEMCSQFPHSEVCAFIYGQELARIGRLNACESGTDPSFSRSCMDGANVITEQRRNSEQYENEDCRDSTQLTFACLDWSSAPKPAATGFSRFL